ncbi:hypothetical protein FK949_gp148 [Paramecium bursaria Chlorella virus NYs1]|uniref:Uncharacterized protein n=1 Tax=Paramecium bursaria Chlorella virus NYs1 TaxID=83442 RepID=M1HHD6_9PHYC|nr:hypothetical protein FK949_gp148 [Paramecium bursaria Chlorella virus NYs1]AGE58713.1 hypothetical protein PBCVNYs1_393L [Paramecium bursaria Chlorella virus NYs1]
MNSIIIVIIIAVMIAMYMFYTKRTNIDAENEWFPPVKNNIGVGDINYYKRKFGDVDN